MEGVFNIDVIYKMAISYFSLTSSALTEMLNIDYVSRLQISVLPVCLFYIVEELGQYFL